MQFLCNKIFLYFSLKALNGVHALTLAAKHHSVPVREGGRRRKGREGGREKERERGREGEGKGEREGGRRKGREIGRIKENVKIYFSGNCLCCNVQALTKIPLFIRPSK